jgi:hypothetical protein
MGRSFARLRQPSGVFGQPLTHLLQREHGEVPLVLSRLVGEIERRGLDTPGLYYCGHIINFKFFFHNLCLPRISKSAVGNPMAVVVIQRRCAAVPPLTFAVSTKSRFSPRATICRYFKYLGIVNLNFIINIFI